MVAVVSMIVSSAIVDFHRGVQGSNSYSFRSQLRGGVGVGNTSQPSLGAGSWEGEAFRDWRAPTDGVLWSDWVWGSAMVGVGVALGVALGVVTSERVSVLQ